MRLCYALLMKAHFIAIGMLIGASAGIGLTLTQAETKIVRGQPKVVVAYVMKGHVHETPIIKRCLWVGIPAGLVGAGIGHFVASGVGLGSVLLGALIMSALSSGWRENWPSKFGQAGENAKVSDSLLHGLVGGLFAAAATAYMRKHHDATPSRLAPPQSGDAV